MRSTEREGDEGDAFRTHTNAMMNPAKTAGVRGGAMRQRPLRARAAACPLVRRRARGGAECGTSSSPSSSCRRLSLTATRFSFVVRAATPDVDVETKRSFMDDMKKAAINLHTKDQAASGGQEAPKQKREFKPTREGYLRFLTDSRTIFSTLEDIIRDSNDPSLATLRDTGLVRTAALDEDIAYLADLGIQPAAFEGTTPGTEYARYMQDLARDNTPAFICHYYNTYFAHTSGGAMIGKSVSKSCLDGAELQFYKYGRSPSSLKKDTMALLEDVAAGWTEAERQACIDETPKAFEMAGKVLRQIVLT